MYVCMYIWFDWGWCHIVESTAPELLRITLQVLRLVNAAPVQLRRVAAGWRLAVRPSRLENFRFLIAIMLGMFVKKHLNYFRTVHTYSITYKKYKTCSLPTGTLLWIYFMHVSSIMCFISIIWKIFVCLFLSDCTFYRNAFLLFYINESL